MTHYGLHTDGDLVFLHQQEGSVCLTPGLGALPSPFAAPPRRGPRCPHHITPSPGELPPSDPVIDVLRPVPNGGAYWAPLQDRPLVFEAAKMCSPSSPTIFPMWAHSATDLIPQLNLTNIAPLILVSAEAKHLRSIAKLLELPRVRTILFCGVLRPPGTTPLKGGELPNINWRAAGAAALHAHVIETVEKARAA